MKWRDKCKRAAEILGHTETFLRRFPKSGFREHLNPDDDRSAPAYLCWPDYRMSKLDEARDALPNRFHGRYTLVLERFRGPDDVRVHYDHDWQRDMKYMCSLACKPEPEAIIDLLLHLDIEGEL